MSKIGFLYISSKCISITEWDVGNIHLILFSIYVITLPIHIIPAVIPIPRVRFFKTKLIMRIIEIKISNNVINPAILKKSSNRSHIIIQPACYQIINNTSGIIRCKNIILCYNITPVIRKIAFS